MNRGEHCMLQRTRTVDGVEGVATPEYFNALRAVNFITRQNMDWSIDPKAERDYEIEEMIEHAKEIAAERGLELTIKTNEFSGFIRLDVIR